jgi:hypothetical protein
MPPSSTEDRERIASGVRPAAPEALPSMDRPGNDPRVDHRHGSHPLEITDAMSMPEGPDSFDQVWDCRRSRNGNGDCQEPILRRPEPA